MELVLLWYKMRHCVGLVIPSLLLSTTQQPPNKPLASLSNMPMMNSRTFQSSSGLNTITRPSPRRSGGDYPSGQQVVVKNLVSFWWRLICFDLDPWHGLYRPPLDPGVQDLGDGWLSLGASPFQPQGIGAIVSGNWTCRIYVFLWTFISLCFFVYFLLCSPY